jgi:hypothetical protein
MATYVVLSKIVRADSEEAKGSKGTFEHTSDINYFAGNLSKEDLEQFAKDGRTFAAKINSTARE